jgi:hypothetical protein
MSRRHHHGNVFVGRIMVAAGFILALGANALIFRIATLKPHPVTGLKVISIISSVWMLAGAGAMCMRLAWGRYLMLSIVSLSAFCFFLTGLFTLSIDEGAMVGKSRPIFAATAIYLFVTLVLMHSRHVRRLTSRTWE